MGEARHHMIVITYWKPDTLAKAWQKAQKLQLTPTTVIASAREGWLTFYITPDGSKEGWTESEVWDDRRLEFCAFLEEECPVVDYVLLEYGGSDGRPPLIVRFQ